MDARRYGAAYSPSEVGSTSSRFPWTACSTWHSLYIDRYGGVMGHRLRLDQFNWLTESATFSDPPVARALFHSTRAGLLWVPMRSYLGYEWLKAGFEQLRDPTWMDGSQVLAFWWGTVDGPGSVDQMSSSFVWYRAFLNGLIDAGVSELFARLIVFGEILVGAALVLGAFVGIAAFFGALMNMNFMLLSSASSNPVLLLGAVGLMLSWQVAGYYGLDRWLLPSVGMPWPEKSKGRGLL